MSTPITNHAALYGAKNSASQPLPRANFFVSPASGYADSRSSSNLAPSSIGGLKQDQVCFRGKKDTQEAADTDETDSTSRNDQTNSGKNRQTNQPGYHQNNAREIARIALCDVAP